MFNLILKKEIILILLLLNLFFFLFGFYINENAAGGGDYFGDIIAIWKNQNLFLNKTILEAITDSTYFDSRPPTAYIMHKYFNFFFYDLESYRKSTFAISILVPLILIFYLKKIINNKPNILIIFFASILLLSPFFRTTAYWGLEENYGLVFLLLNSIALLYFDIKKSFKVIFFICIFSSLSFYFDQKLLIIPLISFFYLFFSENLNLIKKYYIILLYFFCSIPYLYLIYVWGGIIPSGALHRTGGFYWQNVAFVISIISFYLFPFLICKKKILFVFKNFFELKTNIILIILSFIYILIFFIFSDQFEKVNYGNGAIYKISFLLFENPLYRKFLFCLSLLFSVLIILAYFATVHDRLITLFFVLLGLILNPIYQEYFDPLIFIMMLTIFKEKIEINFKNTLLLFFYHLTFLIGSIVYYNKILY